MRVRLMVEGKSPQFFFFFLENTHPLAVTGMCTLGLGGVLGVGKGTLQPLMVARRTLTYPGGRLDGPKYSGK